MFCRKAADAHSGVLASLWPFASDVIGKTPRYTIDVYSPGENAPLNGSLLPISGSIVAPVRGHRHVAIHSAGEGSLVSDICSVVRNFCQLDFLAREASFLHASAVATEESAILFVGESGCGKTTMSLQGAAAGHKYMSNDRVIIEQVNGAICARGWADEIRIFKSPIKPKERLSLKEKFSGDCSKVETRSLPVAAIVFPSTLPSAGSIEARRITPIEAISRFEEKSLSCTGNGYEVWEKIIRSAPLFEIVFPYSLASSAYRAVLNAMAADKN